jgi:hypothetical protein
MSYKRIGDDTRVDYTHICREDLEFLMTMEEFYKAVKSGSIVNDDGTGYFANDHLYTNIYVYPNRMRREGPSTEFTHVMWYNK